MRSFKTGIYVIICTAILSGCVTQRRCLEKFPITPIDTVITEIVVYRDTMIVVTLPADTIRDSVLIYVDMPTQPIPASSVTVKNDFAQSTARIVDNYLKVDLILNERRLEFYIDSIAEIRTKTVTVTQTIVQKEKHVPLIYKASLFISIVLILLFMFGIYVSSRR